MIIEINLETWQWIFYFAAVIVGIFLVVFLYKFFKHFLRGMGWEKKEKDVIQKRWAEITKYINEDNEMGFRVAILEADKLLDHALKQKFFAGNTLAERLKLAQYKYPGLRRVWLAHRLRNDLAHEPTFTLSKGVAEDAIKEYERALKELGAL